MKLQFTRDKVLLLQSSIATIQLYINGLYSFITYFRNTMVMPSLKI